MAIHFLVDFPTKKYLENSCNFFNKGEADSLVDKGGNAYSLQSVSANSYDVDYFNVVPGLQVNGQFGEDVVERDAVIPWMHLLFFHLVKINVD